MYGEIVKTFNWLPNTWKSKNKKLPVSRIIFAGSCLVLAFMYPGPDTPRTVGIHQERKIIFPQLVSPSPYPASDGTPAPEISARAVIVQDADSKTILYERNADAPMMPASTTKIMTALVALDTYKDLSIPLEVKVEDHAIGSSMKLKKGEHISVQNLLYGLLIPSGNDAALALADNYPRGYDAFVEAMNQKARALHLSGTHYKNPSGVEQIGHETTARDLATLAKVAMENPVIANIVKIQAITITDDTGKIVHHLESTDKLLGNIPGLLGLKTGWTENAGECLVSYVNRDGHKIVSVVLGSDDRFGDTQALINWVYAHHTWENIDRAN